MRDYYFETGNKSPVPPGGLIKVRRLATPEEIEDARSILDGDDSMEVDDNAFATDGDGGVWVQAWVRITNGGEDE